MKKLPDTPEYWETITCPKRIKDILLQRNRHHFGQASETPFATPPLQLEVGYKANGIAVDTILSGNVQLAAVPVAARLLIRHLKQRTTTTIPGSITVEQITEKLKVWKETTTTSPSGIHLGHYHCLWRSPTSTGDTKKDEQIKKQQKLLLQATAQLMNYALRHGYSYERWAKVVNVMLQKEAGNPRVHRLRVIHIYEADYNLLLAVKWREALHNAEDNRLLNDGLYGSRPGRTAHDPVLLEVLQHEIYRMSMKAGIIFDLDATSCYDRILVNVASLCSQRIGTHKSVVLVNAQTLEKARYHIKTNFLGVSERSYTHCNAHPIHGTGQGSGNSPTLWCFVCSTLFDAIETVTTGAIFSSYNRDYNVHLYMIGFVDDCSQRVNNFHANPQPNALTLLQTMERDAQQWNNILWASGGALEQSKGSYYLIESSWNADGHPFLQGGSTSPPIRLFDGHQYHLVNRKSSHESHKTLGCFINSAHNNHSAWQATRKKNLQFTTLVETNYLTRSKAQVFYTSIYIPSLTYALPMAPLTNQQCTDLNSKFLRVLLPRLGYNRNIASALRYVPSTHGGVGLKHLHYEQGSLLLQHVFKYLNSPHTQLGLRKQLTQINSCRRYLQALTVADICLPSGTKIYPEARVHVKSPSEEVLRGARFNQPKPGPRAWNTWWKFLRIISNKDGVLYQRLGKWTVLHTHTRYRHTYVYDPKRNQLYSHYCGDLYRAHAHITGNYYEIAPSSRPCAIQGYPTSVVMIMDRLCPLKDYCPTPPPPVFYNPTTDTFHPKWQAELLSGIQHLQPKDTIIHLLSQENVITCSDGAVDKEKSSYGFIVSTSQGLRLAHGSGNAPGAHPNSFCSKAYGVLAALVWAQALSNHWINSMGVLGKWTHYLDNKSVIQRIKSTLETKHDAPNAVLRPEHDVIKEIAMLIPQLPWTVEIEWVKGHQDSTNPFHQLPLEAQLNCQADRLATSYCSPTGISDRPAMLPNSPCQLSTDHTGKSYHEQLKRRVLISATLPSYHKYLCHRYEWHASVIDDIDWDSYIKVLKSISTTQRPTIVKHLLDLSPTGHIAHRNNPAFPPHCPACQHDPEDNTHVMRCPAPSRVRWRSIVLCKLQKWDDARSDPILIDYYKTEYDDTLPPQP